MAQRDGDLTVSARLLVRHQGHYPLFKRAPLVLCFCVRPDGIGMDHLLISCLANPEPCAAIVFAEITGERRPFGGVSEGADGLDVPAQAINAI